MKPERSTLGGFESPSDNKWHSFTIADDGVAFMKKKDAEGNPTEELSDTISFSCEVVESEEKGRKTFVNCDLSKKGGRTSCARFLYYCKLSPILEKDFNMSGDCNEVEWGEKYLNPDNSKCQKVIDAIVTKAPGKSFDGYIKHSEYQGKTYANISELAMYGKGGEGEEKGDKGKSEKSSGASNKKSGDDDVGDW